LSKPDIPPNTKLIVTSRVYWELDAASEIWHCLKTTGVCNNAEIVFVKQRNKLIRGLFAVVFDGDSREAVRRIRNYLLKHPWIMKYSQRIIPVELVTVNFDEVINFVKENSKRINEGARWMIRVSRHHADVSKTQIIEKLAPLITRGKVDLKNPEWIINVECILKTFAIAIVKKEELIRRKELKELLKGRLLENN